MGGIGGFLLSYQKAIDTTEIQFDYLLCSDTEPNNFDFVVNEYGAKVYQAPSLKLSNFKKIKKIVKQILLLENYDAVHLHSANMGFLCLKIAKQCGVKLRIVHSHSTKFSTNKLKSVRNYFLCKYNKKYLNSMFACGKDAGIAMFGLRNLKNITIIPNSILSEKFRLENTIRLKLRESFGITNEIALCYVSRLTNGKNHELLIKCMQILKEYNFKLFFIGDGENEKELKEKCIVYNVEKNVFFLGRRNDVNQVLMAMDIFCMPSKFEGFPVVLVEAQASGLPCVISNRITDEVVFSNNVMIPNDFDVEKWCETIIKASGIKRYDGVSLIRNMGYDVNISAKKLTNKYKELLEKLN